MTHGDTSRDESTTDLSADSAGFRDFLNHFRMLSETAHRTVVSGDGQPFVEALSAHLG